MRSLLLLTPLLLPTAAQAQPAWNISHASSPHAIFLQVDSNDADDKATISFTWRKQGDKSWRPGPDMIPRREGKQRLFDGALWPVDPATLYDIEFTWEHPNGNPVKKSLQVKTMFLHRDPAADPQPAFYVSPQGDDAGTGAKDKPFKTLARAGKAVKPGQTIYALSGVYPEHDLFKGLKGAPDAPIVIAAAPGATPILDSSLVLEPGKTAWKETAPGVFATSIAWPQQQFRYLAQDGLRVFPCPTLDELKKNTLDVVRGWFYDDKSETLYVRPGSGQSAAKHTYHLSRDDHAVDLSGSADVVLRGFTIRHYGAAAIRLSPSLRCQILQNTIHNSAGGVFLKGEQCAFNILWGNHLYERGMTDFAWPAFYAVGYPSQAVYSQKAGRGNAFCHNRLHDWFDHLSIESWKNPTNLELHRYTSILFNEIWNTVDDAIEVDGGGLGMIIHGNAIRNAHSAISLAPVERGPVWVTRNTASFRELFLKFNVGGVTSHGPTFIYHNTGYCLFNGPDGGTPVSFPPGIPCTNKVLKNNIFISNEWSVRAGKDGNTLDANCYWHVPGKPPRRFQWEKKPFATLAAFSQATGQEKHGLYADPLLEAIPDVGSIKVSGDYGKIPPAKLYEVKDAKSGKVGLRPGSPCVDRGVVIRGINDDFLGKGPDLGALEAK